MGGQARPTLGLLHSTVQGLVIMYQVTFGTSFPPLNTTLLVFKFMKALGLPRTSTSPPLPKISYAKNDSSKS